MIRKISYARFALGLVAIGYVGLKKLNYWERSIWIFRTGETAMAFERGGRGGRSGGGGFERGMPGENRDAGRSGREIRPGARPGGEGRIEHGNNQARNLRSYEGRGRDVFPGGEKIRLRTVGWYLAVFAAFTAITIYADKAMCLFRRSPGSR
jgi:hypothetical protein